MSTRVFAAAAAACAVLAAGAAVGPHARVPVWARTDIGPHDAFGPVRPEQPWQRAWPADQVGFSGAVDGRLAVISRHYDGRSVFLGVDTSSGATLWQAELPLGPQGNSTGYVLGLRDGRVYASRSYTMRPDHIYALSAADGSILWASQETVELYFTDPLSFTPEGDPIVGEWHSVRRLARQSGATLWHTPRPTSGVGVMSAPASATRAYSWEVSTEPGCNTRVAALDLQSGERLYASACLEPSAQSGLARGPDGTLFVPAAPGLVALRDTGTGFVERWRAPLPYTAFSTLAVGPDGSVYGFTGDYRVARRDGQTGALLGQSAQVVTQTQPIFGLLTDAVGTVFLTALQRNGESEQRLYVFNPDLSLRFSRTYDGSGVPPLLAQDGTLLINAFEALYAFRTRLDDWHAGPVADFDRDGRADLLLRHDDGRFAGWRLSGYTRLGLLTPQPVSARPAQQVLAAGDFDADDRPDLLLRDAATGRFEAWTMNVLERQSVLPLVPPMPEDAGLVFLALADLTGDARPDLLFRQARTGALVVWRMLGVERQSVEGLVPGTVDAEWELIAAADFDGVPGTDLLWRQRATGALEAWLMDGLVRREVATPTPSALTDPRWRSLGAGDTDGDGWPDLLWQHIGSGRLVGWRMQGLARLSSSYLQPDAVWR